MAKKPKAPRKRPSVIERQRVPCTVVMGGEPMEKPNEGGFELLLKAGHRYWDGSGFVTDARDALLFLGVEEAEQVAAEIQKGGVRAVVGGIQLRADAMTPAQLRVFLRQVREGRGNIRLLALIGNFWEKDVTPQEREEWCRFVEERAKLP
jgi:hypothetical protein